MDKKCFVTLSSVLLVLCESSILSHAQNTRYWDVTAATPSAWSTADTAWSSDSAGTTQSAISGGDHAVFSSSAVTATGAYTINTFTAFNFGSVTYNTIGPSSYTFIAASANTNFQTPTVDIESGKTLSLSTNVRLAASGVLTKSGLGTLSIGGSLGASGGSPTEFINNAGISSFLVGRMSAGTTATTLVTVNGGEFRNNNNVNGDYYYLGLRGTGGIFTTRGQSSAVTNTVHFTEVSSNTHTFSGTVQSAPSDTGITAITKNGTYTQVFTGANTYTGATTINGGALLINNATGSGTGTGAVAVNSTGTLGGTGFIQGTVTVNTGATLTPGGASLPGLLSINGTGADLTLSGGSTSSFRLNGTTRGGDYAAININDAITYAGTLLVDFGFAPTIGNTFDLFNFTSQTGTFSAINFVDAGYGGTFDYASGVLTVTAIPEPTTWALLGCGLLATLLLRRRGTPRT